VEIIVSTSSVIEETITGDTPEDKEKNLIQLINDFKRYKSGELLAIFGKDVLYDHMNTPRIILDEKVWHVHMIELSKVFPRYIRQERKTSEKHLVYCKAVMNDNHYYLITILEPNAHDLAHNRDLMIRLGKIAERFREKN